MIDWLVHLALGGFTGAVLAFVIAMFRVGPGKPEFPMGKVACACVFFTLASPFAYVEYHTRQNKAEMFPILKSYFRSDQCPLIGQLESIKILHVSRNSAYALVTSKELESWGGYDHPIMRVKLVKGLPNKSGVSKWAVSKGEVLRSARLNKDNLVWPPYQ